MLLILMLGGCRGVFEFPPQGDTIEVVSPAAPVAAPTPAPIDRCFERARHFPGLVQRDCGDIARETWP